MRKLEIHETEDVSGAGWGRAISIAIGAISEYFGSAQPAGTGSTPDHSGGSTGGGGGGSSGGGGGC